MSAVERVRVGDVMQLERLPVVPVPEQDYQTIGVRSFGKGIFHYDPVPGDQLGSLRFFKLLADRLVISNIKGWEGAVALSSQDDVGRLASNRFLVYRCEPDLVDASWARWYFLSEPGNELLQRASPGSADRNRTLAMKRFEDLAIPLPPVEEQLDVSKRLDLADASLREAQRLAAQQITHIAALRQSLLNRVFDQL